MFYESIEHADYTAVHFENNICFGELNGFFIIKQIETSSVSLHVLSTLVASYCRCFKTELSTGKALNWLNSVCGFLLFPVPVNGIRETNRGTHLLSHQFRQSGHLTAQSECRQDFPRVLYFTDWLSGPCETSKVLV